MLGGLDKQWIQAAASKCDQDFEWRNSHIISASLSEIAAVNSYFISDISLLLSAFIIAMKMMMMMMMVIIIIYV